jgi:hypothetical protein
MAYQFVVCLTSEQQCLLDALIEERRCAPTTLVRALILRKADMSGAQPPRRDEEIAAEVFASVSTVYRVRKVFATCGLQEALYGRARLHRMQIEAPCPKSTESAYIG